MENEKKYNFSITNLAFRMAIKAGISYIIIFLLMKLIGLVHIYQLRYINTLVLFLFTVHTLKTIDLRTGNNLEYLTGLAVCIFIAAVSFSLFASFMFFYLKFFDPAFMRYLIEHAPFGSYLSPLNTAAWLITEGLGIQISFTLIIMEYFKWMQFKLKSKKDLTR